MRLKKKNTSKHLIFFDDTCPLCWRSVHKILSWDKKGIFHFSPIKEATAKAILKSKYDALKNANTLILVENYAAKKQRVWIRGRAVLRISWLLGGFWKLIGWLAFIPCGIDPIYNWVAKRRHRF